MAIKPAMQATQVSNAAMNLADVMIAFAIIVLVYAIWHGHNLKEQAIKAANKRCQTLGLQLLDQTVSFRGFRSYRGRNRERIWYRHYQFEFTSTAEQRYQGRINMVRGQIQAIEFDVHMPPNKDDMNNP